MKITPLLCLFSLLHLPAAAEVLSNGERDRAMSHLHATRKAFLDTTANLSEAQWNFKPAPGRWSVAECAEHITQSENFLRGMLQGRVKEAAPDESKREARRAGRESEDQKILVSIADRTRKAQAPEPLQPLGKWKSRDEVIREFKSRRDATICYVETTKDDLRGRTIEMRPGMEIDLYQMALMISAHTDRHLQQMREVKADPAFPKK